MENESGSSIYLPDHFDLGEEILRSVRITLMGIDIREMPPATFAPEETSFLSDWETWIHSPFKDILRPHIESVYHAISATHHHDVVALDQKLSSALANAAAKQSIEAGTIFRDTKQDARHMAQWLRFEEKLNDGTTPGHLATLVAIQSALFNVPLYSALFSYGWLEFSAASTSLRSNRVRSTNQQGTFERPALDLLKSALSEPGSDSHGLRAI